MDCLSVGLSVCDREPCKAAKTSEAIEMLFAMWTQVGARKRVLDGAAHWRNLVNTTELSMCGGDVALCQITLTTCSLLMPNVYVLIRKVLRSKSDLHSLLNLTMKVMVLDSASSASLTTKPSLTVMLLNGNCSNPEIVDPSHTCEQ